MREKSALMPYLHHPQFVPKQLPQRERKEQIVWSLTVCLPAPRPGPRKIDQWPRDAIRASVIRASVRWAGSSAPTPRHSYQRHG